MGAGDASGHGSRDHAAASAHGDTEGNRVTATDEVGAALANGSLFEKSAAEAVQRTATNATCAARVTHSTPVVCAANAVAASGAVAAAVRCGKGDAGGGAVGCEGGTEAERSGGAHAQERGDVREGDGEVEGGVLRSVRIQKSGAVDAGCEVHRRREGGWEGSGKAVEHMVREHGGCMKQEEGVGEAEGGREGGGEGSGKVDEHVVRELGGCMRREEGVGEAGRGEERRWVERVEGEDEGNEDMKEEGEEEEEGEERGDEEGEEQWGAQGEEQGEEGGEEVLCGQEDMRRLPAALPASRPVRRAARSQRRPPVALTACSAACP
ncbi:unnamed protein product [Closterium sp. Yama58-4]|nr:unnamed protein product [Closterium sp. Yama58-4]